MDTPYEMIWNPAWIGRERKQMLKSGFDLLRKLKYAIAQTWFEMVL